MVVTRECSLILKLDEFLDTSEVHRPALPLLGVVAPIGLQIVIFNKY